MPPKAAASKPAPAPAEAAAPADVAQLSFEQAIVELEAIVDRMEAGELSLQQALAAYQRGAALVGRCRDSLESVTRQVQVLEDGLLRPLEASRNGQAEHDR